MRIAVPYQDGEIFQKFGPAEAFKLYDVENGAVTAAQIISTAGVGHAGLAAMLKEKGTDELIGGGIGPGAQEALTELGIRFYAGVSGPADAAVQALLQGTLQYDLDAKPDV